MTVKDAGRIAALILACLSAMFYIVASMFSAESERHAWYSEIVPWLKLSRNMFALSTLVLAFAYLAYWVSTWS